MSGALLVLLDLVNPFVVLLPFADLLLQIHQVVGLGEVSSLRAKVHLLHEEALQELLSRSASFAVRHGVGNTQVPTFLYRGGCIEKRGEKKERSTALARRRRRRRRRRAQRREFDCFDSVPKSSSSLSVHLLLTYPVVLVHQALPIFTHGSASKEVGDGDPPGFGFGGHAVQREREGVGLVPAPSTTRRRA